MLFADTMAIFFVIVGLLIAFPSLWLVCRALWPGQVERAARQASRRPILSFLAGVPVTGAAILLTLALGGASGAVPKALGGVLFCLFLLYAEVGIAGFATHLGLSLPSPVDRERPWRATLRGGVALELSWLLPLLGWFVILPISTVLGAGTTTLAFFARRSGRPIVETDHVPSPILDPVQVAR